MLPLLASLCWQLRHPPAGCLEQHTPVNILGRPCCYRWSGQPLLRVKILGVHNSPPAAHSATCHHAYLTLAGTGSYKTTTTRLMSNPKLGQPKPPLTQTLNTTHRASKLVNRTIQRHVKVSFSLSPCLRNSHCHIRDRQYHMQMPMRVKWCSSPRLDHGLCQHFKCRM